jgi:hypothetical protein
VDAAAYLPEQPGYSKRRRKLAATMTRLIRGGGGGPGHARRPDLAG